MGAQIIETTDNHPFWVEGKGWVFANELQVGDKLQKADGTNLTIDKVEFVKLDTPVTVYNFTVDHYHTYYVTDVGIWVHNTKCSIDLTESTGETAKSVNKYWDNVIEFNGNKVYPRNDLFDPTTISSWKVKGKSVTGTNAERMASGRAPIGYDGKSINLHHLTQTQSGSIAEVSQSFHQKYYSILHINTGGLPSGINRAKFDVWKKGYWINRSNDFMQ